MVLRWVVQQMAEAPRIKFSFLEDGFQRSTPRMEFARETVRPARLLPRTPLAVNRVRQAALPVWEQPLFVFLAILDTLIRAPRQISYADKTCFSNGTEAELRQTSSPDASSSKFNSVDAHIVLSVVVPVIALGFVLVLFSFVKKRKRAAARKVPPVRRDPVPEEIEMVSIAEWAPRVVLV